MCEEESELVFPSYLKDILAICIRSLCSLDCRAYFVFVFSCNGGWARMRSGGFEGVLCVSWAGVEKRTPGSIWAPGSFEWMLGGLRLSGWGAW